MGFMYAMEEVDFLSVRCKICLTEKWITQKRITQKRVTEKRVTQKRITQKQMPQKFHNHASKHHVMELIYIERCSTAQEVLNIAYKINMFGFYHSIVNLPLICKEVLQTRARCRKQAKKNYSNPIEYTIKQNVHNTTTKPPPNHLLFTSNYNTKPQ